MTTRIKSDAVDLPELASAPDMPATNRIKFYAKSDGIYIVDDAGQESGVAGISSVNGDTGPAIVLDAADVGAETTSGAQSKADAAQAAWTPPAVLALWLPI